MVVLVAGWDIVLCTCVCMGWLEVMGFGTMWVLCGRRISVTRGFLRFHNYCPEYTIVL